MADMKLNLTLVKIFVIDFQERVFASIGQTSKKNYLNWCEGVLTIVEVPYENKEE